MNNNTRMKEEFLPSHDFLDYCRKCIISMINYTDEKRLADQPIKYKSDDDRVACEVFCKNKDNNAEQWLMENGYKDVMYSFYYKQLFFSLLIDFSNYYTASIEMALNGNINVAWALLRKPLQEALAYFEWLYVDRKELLGLMIEGNNVKAYDIMNKSLLNKRKEHIEKIQAKRGSGKIDMFEFRYSYDNEFTLNGILQATNHLITTRPALKTSPSGLNYIFLDDEIVNRNIGFYYTSIPYVMLYAMDIIMYMFEEIATLGDYTSIVNHLNLWIRNFCAIRTTFEKAKEILALNEISLYCPKCGKEHNSDKVWIDFSYDHFVCEYCRKRVDTDQYVLDFETIKVVNSETEEKEDEQA